MNEKMEESNDDVMIVEEKVKTKITEEGLFMDIDEDIKKISLTNLEISDPITIQVDLDQLKDYLIYEYIFDQNARLGLIIDHISQQFNISTDRFLIRYSEGAMLKIVQPDNNPRFLNFKQNERLFLERKEEPQKKKEKEKEKEKEEKPPEFEPLLELF